MTGGQIVVVLVFTKGKVRENNKSEKRYLKNLMTQSVLESSKKQIKHNAEKSPALRAADTADPHSYQILFCPAAVYKV